MIFFCLIMASRPLYLRLCLSICRALAIIASGLHNYLIKLLIITPPAWYNKVFEGQFKHLKNIWYARITRRFISVSVRTVLRKDILKLVSLNIELPLNSGCVVVICHTPWKRLLIQWCIEQKNILIIAAANWVGKRRDIQNKAIGFRDVKKVINHLHQNGRIITTLDLFNELNNCPVTFLGKNRNVSMLPVRLSKLGEVPLIMAIPVFQEGIIKFIQGQYFTPPFNKLNSCAVMQNFINDLENKIKMDLSIWPEYVK